MAQALVLLVAFQLAIFAIFILSRKQTHTTKHTLLAFFFLSLAINIFNIFCIHSQYVIDKLTFLLMIGTPFAFLYSPLLYLYIRSLTDRYFRLNKYHVLHTLPFLAFSMYLMFIFYFISPENKRFFIYQQRGQLTKTFVTILNIQVLLYFFATLKCIREYRLHIKNFYSSIEKINFSWLKFIFWGFICLWLIDISRFIINQTNPYQEEMVETIFFFTFSVLSGMLLYKALTQPEIFMSQIEIVPKKKKNLSDKIIKHYQVQLFKYMEKEKPYLQTTLTIFDLSKKTSIPVRSLSDVINNSLNQNFYDFVNSFRIKESQRLLSDTATRGKTILEILYETGFNTKSSFNKAFKKHTGTTPTLFRQKNLPSN